MPDANYRSGPASRYTDLKRPAAKPAPSSRLLPEYGWWCADKCQRARRAHAALFATLARAPAAPNKILRLPRAIDPAARDRRLPNCRAATRHGREVKLRPGPERRLPAPA